MNSYDTLNSNYDITYIKLYDKCFKLNTIFHSLSSKRTNFSLVSSILVLLKLPVFNLTYT